MNAKMNAETKVGLIMKFWAVASICMLANITRLPWIIGPKTYWDGSFPFHTATYVSLGMSTMATLAFALDIFLDWFKAKKKT